MEQIWEFLDGPARRIIDEKNVNCKDDSLYKCCAIVFSKDRAFQLGKFLHSFDSHCGIDNSTTAAYSVHVKVVYTCSSDKHREGYECIEKESVYTCFDSCEYIYQYPGQLSHTLNQVIQTPADFIMFCVDDMMVHANLCMPSIMQAMQKHTRLFSFHTRLDPDISYSVTRGCDVHVPELLNVSGFDTEFCMYSGVLVEPGEWNYPWDLSGGVYRYDTVVRILRLIGQSGLTFDNPNEFEIAGNQIIDGHFEELFEGKLSNYSFGCFRSSRLKVLCINRVVQSSCCINPLLHEEEQGVEETDTDSLLEYVIRFREVRLSYPQNGSSVHVPGKVVDV